MMFMAFENLFGLFGNYTGIVVVIAFILFVFFIKRTVKILMNVVWIAVASFLFPMVVNFLLDTSIPLTLESFTFFVTLGLGLYAAYLFTKIVYIILGVVEKILKGVAYPFAQLNKKKKEQEDKEVREYVKEKKKQEKNNR